MLIEKFQESFLTIERQINRFDKRPISFFEQIGFQYNEGFYSNFIYFFLNPHEEHGFRDLFLKSLVIAYSENVSYLDEDIICSEVGIDTEVPTKSGNFIDLVVETNNYVIVIENKIKHKDINPFDDYVNNFAEVNNKNKIFVLLSVTPIKSKESHNKFRNLTYLSWIKIIKANYAQYIENANPKYIPFLNDFFINISSVYNMSNNFELVNFCFQNKKEIQEIQTVFEEQLKAFNKLLNPLFAVVAEKMNSPESGFNSYGTWGLDSRNKDYNHSWVIISNERFSENKYEFRFFDFDFSNLFSEQEYFNIQISTRLLYNSKKNQRYLNQELKLFCDKNNITAKFQLKNIEIVDGISHVFLRKRYPASNLTINESFPTYIHDILQSDWLPILDDIIITLNEAKNIINEKYPNVR